MAPAGRSVPPSPSKTVAALPRVRTSSSVPRTLPHAAAPSVAGSPKGATVANPALRFNGWPTLVLSPVGTSQTLEKEIPADRTR